MRFSVIIPVYNRPDEVDALLRSLSCQTCRDFEVVIAEDGSTLPCRDVVERYAGKMDIKYLSGPNEGRSIARNHAMEASSGDWLVFFDSDCEIPPQYFGTLRCELDRHRDIDCYGGPDTANASFSTTQRAINFAMTSLLTTGGIRGGRVSMEKFTPRTFNMGFSRKVYQRVGGFREMFSEDIDMSKRIEAAGFTTALLRNVPVYHKRRVSLGKFFRQVYVFGMSRITLQRLYPGSLKPVHALPACFVIGSAGLLGLGAFLSPWWLLPLGVYAGALAVSAAVREHSVKVALKAVPAAFVQLAGYGLGFLKAFAERTILRRNRDIDKEIAIRKGK